MFFAFGTCSQCVIYHFEVTTDEVSRAKFAWRGWAELPVVSLGSGVVLPYCEHSLLHRKHPRGRNAWSQFNLGGDLVKC